MRQICLKFQRQTCKLTIFNQILNNPHHLEPEPPGYDL